MINWYGGHFTSWYGNTYIKELEYLTPCLHAHTFYYFWTNVFNSDSEFLYSIFVFSTIHNINLYERFLFIFGLFLLAWHYTESLFHFLRLLKYNKMNS